MNDRPAPTYRDRTGFGPELNDALPRRRYRSSGSPLTGVLGLPIPPAWTDEGPVPLAPRYHDALLTAAAAAFDGLPESRRRWQALSSMFARYPGAPSWLTARTGSAPTHNLLTLALLLGAIAGLLGWV